MPNTPWDTLEHHLAELLLVDRLPVRKAIPHVCQTFPKARVSVLVLAVSSSASVMDTGGPIADPENLPLSFELYRAVTMICADLALCDLLGRDIPDCAALLAHWHQSSDPFFSP